MMTHTEHITKFGQIKFKTSMLKSGLCDLEMHIYM